MPWAIGPRLPSLKKKINSNLSYQTNNLKTELPDVHPQSTKQNKNCPDYSLRESDEQRASSTLNRPQDNHPHQTHTC